MAGPLEYTDPLSIGLLASLLRRQRPNHGKVEEARGIADQLEGLRDVADLQDRRILVLLIQYGHEGELLYHLWVEMRGDATRLDVILERAIDLSFLGGEVLDHLPGRLLVGRVLGDAQAPAASDSGAAIHAGAGADRRLDLTGH